MEKDRRREERGTEERGRRDGEDRRRRHEESDGERDRHGNRDRGKNRHTDEAKAQRHTIPVDLDALVTQREAGKTEEHDKPMLLMGGAAAGSAVLTQTQDHHHSHEQSRDHNHSDHVRSQGSRGTQPSNEHAHAQTHARPSPHDHQHPPESPKLHTYPRPSLPHHARGPDGTPFGRLPQKKKGMGFGEHFLNTYRHIKAEHEAGHRERGALELRLDKMRGKGVGMEKGDGGGKGRGRGRREGGGRRGGKGDRGEDKGPRHASSHSHSHPAQSHPSALQQTAERDMQHAHPTSAQHDTPPGHVFSYGPPTLQGERLREQFPDAGDDFLGVRRESEVDTLPRDFSNLNVLEEASGGDISPTHTAPGVLDVDRHAAGGPKIPPRPTGTPALPPTPLSAPSPVPLRNSTLHSLLSAIQSGPSLQPVSLGNINDNNAARGGQELYENTTHSRGIEAKERGQEQGQEEDWAAIDDGGSEIGGAREGV
ncbi:hypothetical protein IAQ61_009237 [Plenodomus lingam]|uniref:uncharacterized protein n=1 Tax=Leptosphaeria maculans TaxID=5022 RepID=UPI00331A9C7A|nr:hypothetical protein IAQ61_009237 [Plenodomus lingam]